MVFLAGNHQVYGHNRCIYTVLANPTYIRCWPTLHMHPRVLRTGDLIRPEIADARERLTYNRLVGAGTYIFRWEWRTHTHTHTHAHTHTNTHTHTLGVGVGLYGCEGEGVGVSV